MLEHRRSAFERISWILDDFDHAHTQLVEVDQRLVAVLDELGLTELVTSIDGLSAVGAAAILAETGDLTRFTSARAVVKHAGLAPRERMSGAFTGRARLTGAGRPELRAAAWRAVWGCLQNNQVHAARYRHLTTRETNRLKPTQAQAVVAAGLLRRPATAALRDRHHPAGLEPRHRLHWQQARRHGRPPGGHRCLNQPLQATRPRRHQPGVHTKSWVGASPQRHWEPHRYPVCHHGQPRPSSTNPITRCRAQLHYLCRDRRKPRDTRPSLDTKRLTLMRVHAATLG